MEQQIAYQVIVTTDWRLNIILTNKRKEQLRSYSHFVTQEQAAQFAHTLENTVLLGHYTKLTTCPLCGKAFFRQDKLSQMRDGRILHQRCLDRATKQGNSLLEIVSNTDTAVSRKTFPFSTIPA